MGVIVTIILIYFAIRFSFWLLGHVLLHKANKAAQEAGYTDESGTEKPKRKKFFQKETGEYVDFEEINEK